MVESKFEKVKRQFRKFVAALCGHRYSCCDHVTKNCMRCEVK